MGERRPAVEPKRVQPGGWNVEKKNSAPEQLVPDPECQIPDNRRSFARGTDEEQEKHTNTNRKKTHDPHICDRRARDPTAGPDRVVLNPFRLRAAGETVHNT
eukprot:m.130020 g.130020  ORF g.130020 m.130020 type:complete len:102 (+) comp13696_c0_seq1:3449-3754(+)